MKKIIKKGINVFVVTALTTGLLAACGGAKNTAPTASGDYPDPAYGGYDSEPTYSESAEYSAAPSDYSNAKQAAPESDYNSYYNEPPVNTETYEKPDENGAELVATNPLSTFAMDVDTASYANVRRMIEDGYSSKDIPVDAVRPEEFINYFAYDLNSPDNGEAFGITTEIADCPWNEDHKMMFVGLKTADMDNGEMPVSNLVFLIDVSGSMNSSDKLPLLKKSMKELVDNYDGEGTVSIVTYSGHEEVVLEGESIRNKKAQAEVRTARAVWKKHMR